MNDWAILPLFRAQARLVPSVVRSLAEACRLAPAANRVGCFASLLEGMVELREPAEQLYRQAWSDLVANRIDDEEAVGTMLRQTFDQLLAEIESVRPYLTAEPSLAQANFDATERSIRQMRNELERDWPRVDRPMMEAARDEYARGEYEEAEVVLRGLLAR